MASIPFLGMLPIVHKALVVLLQLCLLFVRKVMMAPDYFLSRWVSLARHYLGPSAFTQTHCSEIRQRNSKLLCCICTNYITFTTLITTMKMKCMFFWCLHCPHAFHSLLAKWFVQFLQCLSCVHRTVRLSKNITFIMKVKIMQSLLSLTAACA